MFAVFYFCLGPLKTLDAKMCALRSTLRALASVVITVYMRACHVICASRADKLTLALICIRVRLAEKEWYKTGNITHVTFVISQTGR